MAIDKKELTKLSPQERIKKLKLMEEERKKEVDEIESLIKESMHALKTDKIAEEVAPEQRAVDISRLFEQSGGANLERTARKEALSLAKGAKGYQALVQTYEAYSQAMELYGIVSTGGSLSREQMNLVGEIGERIYTVERYVPESERLANILTATKAALHKLKKETGL